MAQRYDATDYLTLEEIKEHLALVDSDHDDQLNRLARSSISWATSFLNRELHTLDDNSPPNSPFELPEDLKTALLLHIEAYFDRDPQAMAMLLEAAINLAYPYRVCIGV